MKLRCFVFKHQEDKCYYAICYDLCLISQGYSVETIKACLRNQIVEHVHDAYTVDYEHLDCLIPRRYAKYDLLRYYWIKLTNPKNAYSYDLGNIIAEGFKNER